MARRTKSVFRASAMRMSAPGPTRTSQHVRFFAARGGEADISRRMQTDTIYEYGPYADEYTLFDCLDRLLPGVRGPRPPARRGPGRRGRSRCVRL